MNFNGLNNSHINPQLLLWIAVGLYRGNIVTDFTFEVASLSKVYRKQLIDIIRNNMFLGNSHCVEEAQALSWLERINNGPED